MGQHPNGVGQHSAMSTRERPLRIRIDAVGRLSAQLRQSRNAAGLTLRAAAFVAMYSPGYPSHVEHRQIPSEPIVLTLDVLYRADGRLLSLYEEVLGSGRRRP